MTRPAYSRAIIAAQSAGRIVPYLVLSIGWNFGRTFPRLVIADDMQLAELDLRVVGGLDCLIVHHNETTRAFDVAELAMQQGATRCPVHDMATAKTTTTAEVLMARRAAA